MTDSHSVSHSFVMQIYLHYLPLKNSRETKADLGLKNGARWFTYWKGRMVVMADITAM